MLDQPSLFADPLHLAPPPAARPRRSPSKKPAAGPTLAFCVLGSGSGGNCSIVRFGQRTMLLDAGLGPRTISARLGSLKRAVHQIDALCITHLDRDHFRPSWINTLVQWEIDVFLHRWHADQLERIKGAHRLFDAGLVYAFDDDAFEPLSGMVARPIRLPHDTKGTTGFRLDTDAGSLGYATDLGSVPPGLIRHFASVDVLAIESNYDPVMQRQSTRPLFLKRRIMGKAGHLSNEQCFEAVSRILDLSPNGRPQHVVLLHRSSQCNDPAIVRRVFEQDGRLARRLTLSEQSKRTKWLEIRTLAPVVREQLSLWAG